MFKSLIRVLGMYKKYRARLVISQVLVLISATAIIGVASLNQQLINDGIETGDVEAILRTGFKMLLLALLSGVSLAPECRRGQHPERAAVHDLTPAIRAIYAADHLRADHYEHTINGLGAGDSDRGRAGRAGVADPPGFPGI
jgi:ABC-type multidrug transport system fused ATPase/permease subunit